MRFSRIRLALLAAATTISAESPTSTQPIPSCTAVSSSGSGAFFDLRPDRAYAAGDSKARSGITKDYYARGYDYGKNFTMNICGAVVDQVSDVEGLDDNEWADVAAYYTSDGRVYSIGSESMDLQSRGRKLVLQYTGGSPCGRRSNTRRFSSDPNADMYSKASDDKSTYTRQKSTTISFLCDHDPGNTIAAMSFVGTDPDECAYFFEVRSPHACAAAEPHKPGSVGPASIFGVILVIALLVYVLGGVFYNRTVTHARGWRQVPNFSLWAGIWDSITNTFARFLPGRRGYEYAALGAEPAARNRDAEAENRLIDQLDEDWED